METVSSLALDVPSSTPRERREHAQVKLALRLEDFAWGHWLDLLAAAEKYDEDASTLTIVEKRRRNQVDDIQRGAARALAFIRSARFGGLVLAFCPLVNIERIVQSCASGCSRTCVGLFAHENVFRVRFKNSSDRPWTLDENTFAQVLRSSRKRHARRDG